jgi:hypothetical protein
MPRPSRLVRLVRTLPDLPSIDSPSSFRSSEDQAEVASTDPTPEELMEARSQWLSQVLQANPQFLSMRERALPLTSGYSFANVTHTQRVTDIDAIDRFTILELVSQHLQAIGMYRTAEILAEESGYTFQASTQAWDRTDLHLLVSLGVGHREDAWSVPPDFGHLYIRDAFEEDFVAAPYRENPKQISDELYNPTSNVVYDDSGARNSLTHIKACSLRRFVVFLVTLDRVDNEEQQMFLLSLNAITSASHFLEHLVTLYDMDIDERRLASVGLHLTRLEICRNILSLIRNWIGFHRGRHTLDLVAQFSKRALGELAIKEPNSFLGPYLRKLAEQSVGPKVFETRADPPCIPDALRLFRPTLKLLDPEPLEVAHQVTLISHQKFASVHPLEFIIGLSNRKPTVKTPTLAEFFGFGDSLTLLVAEAFLSAERKQVAYDRILEIAKHLADMNNLDALAAVLRFLILDCLGKVVTVQLELVNHLWTRCGEAERKNGAVPNPYDTQIVRQFSNWAPTIPNMHVELKSGVKQPDRKPDYVDGLINWEKLIPHARKCLVMTRFQNMPYNFTVIPQIQKIILKRPEAAAVVLQERLDDLARASHRE